MFAVLLLLIFILFQFQYCYIITTVKIKRNCRPECYYSISWWHSVYAVAT